MKNVLETINNDVKFWVLLMTIIGTMMVVIGSREQSKMVPVWKTLMWENGDPVLDHNGTPILYRIIDNRVELATDE